jgi:hypothetical protein
MSRSDSVNPFIFSRALEPDEAVPRKADVTSLLDTLTSGNNVVVYAPRRLGKTTFLRQLRELAPRRRFQAVEVDFSDVLSQADVAVRLEQALRALPGAARRLVARELGSIGVTTPLGGASAARRDRSLEPLATIHALLDLPEKIAYETDKAVLLVFDEFQALTALPGMDGVVRSHLQHHVPVTCIFCGSEPSMLRRLFEDRARPLYGQALPYQLPKLEFRAAFDFVVDRFLATGKDCTDVAAELLSITELHPQRLMLISYFLWEQAGRRPATMQDLRLAYDAAMRSADPELRVLWDSLPIGERRVVAAIASGLPPFGAAARELTGIRGPSSSQRPLENLRGRSIVVRDEDGSHRLLDPLFQRWVRRNGGARLQLFVVPDGAGGFIVYDGPSQAFERSRHAALDDAEEAAHALAAGSGSDVMIYDTDDPNDLPDWAPR